MPYVANNRPPFTDLETGAYAECCETITPGAADQVDPGGNYYKYLTAATGGDVTFVPYQGDDGTTFTMTLAGGQVLPGRVRRVTAATATVLGWFDK